MALRVRVFASLVTSNELEDAERSCLCARLQPGDPFEDDAAPRSLGDQEEHLVQLRGRRGFEGRKQSGDRLADARRCLREQGSPAARAFVDGFGELTLARVEGIEGERQCAQRFIPDRAML